MEEPRRFTFVKSTFSLVLATIVALIATAALAKATASAPFLIDKAVSVVLVVPDKLGYVDHVTPEETIVLTGDGDHAVVLSRKGEYRIQIKQDQPPVSISLTAKNSDHAIVPIPIDDETEYMFSVVAAGPYTISIDTPERIVLDAGAFSTTIERPEGMAEEQFVIVPYVGATNARVAIISGVIHIAFLVTLALMFFRIANRKRRRQELAIQAKKRDRFEGVIDDLKQSKSQR